jgi:hypothetical protein
VSALESVRTAQFRLPRRAYGWTESARLVARRARTSAPDVDAWVDALPPARTRLLVAPANSAGQGVAWARAASRHLEDVHAAAWMFTTSSSYPFPADVVAPAAVSALPVAWQRRLFDAVARSFTHVIIESGRPQFGGLFGHDAAREAAALGERGVAVAMAWHGTDIRLPSRERATNPHSPYRHAGHRQAIAMLEARARRNAALAQASGVPQFYSTPDLGVHVPGGHWLPVAVEAKVWSVAPSAEHDGPLTVLFQPSQGWVKGADLVEPMLDRLARDGVIARVASARVAPSDMPSLVQRADVVLDQFGLDLYGVAAAEAMMASRPVVALAGPPVRAATLTLTGEDLPIVSAAPGDLERALRRLAADRARREELGARGRAFALRWHDGAASAKALREWLGR